MITIKNLELDVIASIDEELGYHWRQGELPEGAVGCAHVVLGENTCLRVYDSNDFIVLDIGHARSFINKCDFEEVVIK